MKIAIVILNFNQALVTSECVRSILNSGDQTPYHILLVDNASDEESIKFLKREFRHSSSVTILRTKENLGFAGGCNHGIKYALVDQYDGVLLLNNDTEVQPGFLDNLVKRMQESNNLAIYGGQTYFFDFPEELWDNGGFIDSKRKQGIRYRDRDVVRGEKRSFVTLCYALIPKELILRIGLLPDEYFFGVEEWEYSLRIERLGFGLVNVPNARIKHKVGRSHSIRHPRFQYNYLLNRLLFVRRNYSRKEFTFFAIKFLLFKSCQALLGTGDFCASKLGTRLSVISQVIRDMKYNKIHIDRFQ